MPKFELSVNLPEGTDLIRLQNHENGWEACAIAYSTKDKWEQIIPSQFGYSFKQKSPAAALRFAAEDARDKMNKIKVQRANLRDPRLPKLSPEEELLHALKLV